MGSKLKEATELTQRVVLKCLEYNFEFHMLTAGLLLWQTASQFAPFG
jgi:hypothetical protein